MGIRGWQEVVGVVGVFVLLTVIVWQVAASVRARAAVTRDAAYRDLAQRAVSAQEALVAELAETRAQLTDLRTRLGSVERVLTEVE
ncbi:hypothetical protein [Actinokineospora terrae]|uniref:Secreted protein n=1 Tax=Actinokineospora terrae TaxID=155974 RepID=A0A1H9X415_9PSEU|nr:hypothetical protein [Actinokineospora terrae]SES40771.1 hypothetical protein SAMN04487818_112243 [Actinokineospora terrae]